MTFAAVHQTYLVSILAFVSDIVIHPPVYMQEEKQRKAAGMFLLFFFYRCRNETKARFNRLFSREKKKSSITNVTRSAEPHKRRINHRVKPEFALHFLCIGVSLVWTLRQKHAAEMKNVIYELENKISNMNYKSNRSPRRG